eukprot:714789-Pyramimonas_sp.AAC.1
MEVQVGDRVDNIMGPNGSDYVVAALARNCETARARTRPSSRRSVAKSRRDWQGRSSNAPHLT